LPKLKRESSKISFSSNHFSGDAQMPIDLCKQELERLRVLNGNNTSHPATRKPLQIITHEQRLSWQGRILQVVLSVRQMIRKVVVKKVIDEKFIIEKRANEERLAGRFTTLAPIKSETLVINQTIPAEWISCLSDEAPELNGPIIYYVHGGAYTGGSIISHRALCGNLAYIAQARVLIINYRLAPEHPYPAALEDVLAVYQWLLDSSVSPKKVIMAGDSSGGGLILSALVALRDKGEPLPAAAVCLSGIFDLACTGAGWNFHVQNELFVTEESAKRSFRMYLRETDPYTPLASPLYANLAGLPPLFLQAGSKEVLLTDATRLTEKAANAKVSVTLDIWDEMVHGWQFAASFLPEGRGALEEIGKFIKRLRLE
jgi:monoterpene epsilon-lactone hydrolase